jgi:hypothetical protein
MDKPLKPTIQVPAWIIVEQEKHSRVGLPTSAATLKGPFLIKDFSDFACVGPWTR